jgi:hypothetical protein
MIIINIVVYNEKGFPAINYPLLQIRVVAGYTAEKSIAAFDDGFGGTCTSQGRISLANVTASQLNRQSSLLSPQPHFHHN